MLKKADKIVLASILLLSVAASLFMFAFRNVGRTVVIKQQNNLVCNLPLNKDTVYNLEHNTVVIKKGKVFVKSADCPDQICVKHKAISKCGESIVCLPNRVIIEVK